MAKRVETPSWREEIKDRMATAFGSAVMMAITFVFLALVTTFFAIASSFVHLIDGHGVGQMEASARLVQFFDDFIVIAFGVFILLAGLVGFFLGSERMARLFGVFWQTETPTRAEFWIATSFVIGLLGTMFVYTLRKLGIL